MSTQTDPVVKAKPWWQSKIIWAQVITLVATGIEYAITNKLFNNWTTYLMFADAIVTAALRLFFTDTNLTK